MKGTFYSYYGLFDDALKYTLRASELSPNKQSILYQLGNLYLQKQDYAKALEIFKRAYEIEVRNDDAFMYLQNILLFLQARKKLHDSAMSEKTGKSKNRPPVVDAVAALNE
jgi:tetratricopeptide (TPR) repeat protein